jgi:hypothetical protein
LQVSLNDFAAMIARNRLVTGWQRLRVDEVRNLQRGFANRGIGTTKVDLFILNRPSTSCAALTCASIVFLGWIAEPGPAIMMAERDSTRGNSLGCW